MKHIIRKAGAVAALAVGGVGCSDFLTGEGINRDPNQPSTASTSQLFVAMQAAQFGQQTAGVPQYICVIVQHCAGTGNYLETFNRYSIGSGSFTADFSQIYLGGGLVDLKEIQRRTEAAGDREWAGIAKVWEALAVSFGADNWGDIPYRDTQTEGVTAPAFDPQLQVYDDLQALLDEAITDLQSGEGPGPGAIDLVFGGDVDRWTRAAYTLKARLYLHTAEVPARRTAAYTSAIAAATNGINEATPVGQDTGPGDWRTYHTSATNERNMWYQFKTSTFGAYLQAGKFGVDFLEARQDTFRLRRYYSRTPSGGYGGIVDVLGVSDPEVSEVATLTGLTRITDTFRHPLVTWAENQLILAEACAVTGSCNPQPYLDAVRAARKLAPVPATLQAIGEEEYAEYFQMLESWHSYKRLCVPNLQINPSAPASTARITMRLYYGSSEENANPNVPSVAEQNANGGVAPGTGSTAAPGHNPNDPPGGIVNNAAACLGN